MNFGVLGALGSQERPRTMMILEDGGNWEGQGMTRSRTFSGCWQRRERGACVWSYWEGEL